MVAADPHYRTHAPQLDLFQENLDRLLAEGVGVRNPQIIARNERRATAIHKMFRLADEHEKRRLAVRTMLRNLARHLQKG